ncbi:hypothetical protein [Sediminibacillus massiliensis]|nr:hypothetical protein [Sediminibacillus massiliensis]
MKEQDIYKDVLSKLIDKTEKFQISDTQEFVDHLIRELSYHKLTDPE